MMRSIFAVIVGSVVWTMLWLGSNALVMRLFPDWYGEGGKVESVPVLLFTILRSVILSLLAGYITAFIARRSEIKHSFALGVLQLVLGIMATIQSYDVAPLWYHALFLTLLIPSNVFGGWLRVTQKGG